MQEYVREPRRAKWVVEVVWNPFVGFNVDERITETSSGEVAIKTERTEHLDARAGVVVDKGVINRAASFLYLTTIYSKSMFPSWKKKHFPSNSAPAKGLTSQTLQSQPLYPWSAHTPQFGRCPSPFPRFSHTLSTTATATGELFLFGGFAHDPNSSLRRNSDLYVISTRDFSTTLLQTSGDVPEPRYGHCAVLTSTSLLIWGGFTDSHRNDNSFYLLDLGKSDLFDVKIPPS